MRCRTIRCVRRCQRVPRLWFGSVDDEPVPSSGSPRSSPLARCHSSCRGNSLTRAWRIALIRVGIQDSPTDCHDHWNESALDLGRSCLTGILSARFRAVNEIALQLYFSRSNVSGAKELCCVRCRTDTRALTTQTQCMSLIAAPAAVKRQTRHPSGRRLMQVNTHKLLIHSISHT